MSTLLRELVSAVRSASDPSIRAVGGNWLSEEQPQMADSLPVRSSAKVVEGSGGVDPVPVGTPESGLFTHFMDGMQRVHTPLTVGYIPVVYGYVAAVIRLRGTDRKMRTNDHLSMEALYCPLQHVETQWLAGTSIRVIDTSDEIKDGNDNLLAFLNNANHKISHQRELLEKDLINQWLENNYNTSNWLIVDGSLTGNYDNYKEPNILGVAKSHQTQYFDVEKQREIVGMPVGYRSKVFVPLGRNRTEVYSWYLRLHSSAGRDAYFGLIRVEAPAEERTLRLVDDISRRLMAERAPLSLPDHRWDKLIYPIHDCELFLKSRAPSKTQLEAFKPGL